MVQQQWLRQQLAQVVQQPEANLNLAQAALLIAQQREPELVLEDYLDRLDGLARRAASRLSPEADAAARLEALHAVLFAEEGFTGNRTDYYDPSNSLLHHVLNQRTGIPITLSVVYLEVGWRLGLRLDGVGLPGHFIVVHHSDQGAVYLDPYNGGAALTEEDCADLVAQLHGDPVDFQPAYLRPVTKRQILFRMLNNLRSIYERTQDYGEVLAVLDQMLIVDPDAAGELQQRGQLYLRYRALAFATADFERLTTLAPLNPAAADARRHLTRIRQMWAN